MADFPVSAGLEEFSGGFLSTSTILNRLSVTSSFSTAWPSANLAIFVPIRIPFPVVVYKLVIGAGATAAGNFDVGIYDASGNRLVSSGATAKGASTEQVLDIADTTIGPGLFYLAMSADGTNNYVMTTPSGSSPVPLQKVRLVGVVQMAAAYVLPATATFAAASTAVAIPAINAQMRPY